MANNLRRSVHGALASGVLLTVPVNHIYHLRWVKVINDSAAVVTFKLGIERRIAGAEKIGAHKTSMLQDVEAGRAIELEALVGSVLELARLTGVETPRIDAAYALMQLLVQTLDHSKGRLQIEPQA